MGSMAIVAVSNDGYYPPNFRVPINATRVRESIAPRATAKGVYFITVMRELAQQGHHLEGFGPYRDFGDYPVATAFTLLLEAANRLYPNDPTREAIRRIAWNMFPALLGTMVGRVLFGALGNDMLAVARYCDRGFEVSLSQGRCQTVRAERGLIELKVTNFQLLPDCFLVGVLEGWLAYYGYDGDVLIRPAAHPKDVDYLIRWS